MYTKDNEELKEIDSNEISVGRNAKHIKFKKALLYSTSVIITGSIIFGLFSNLKKETDNKNKLESIKRKIESLKDENTIKNNEYHNDFKFEYINDSDNYEPKNRKELIDLFYTILNSGCESFTFKCSKDYDNWEKDINYIKKDPYILQCICNYVHPYNSFESISISYSDEFVYVIVKKVYSDNEISIINNIKEIIEEEYLNDSMSTLEKVKVLHDYIVNNTSFDYSDDEERINQNKSRSAYGLLTNGKALCSGYADMMSLFLYDLGIPNYRISSFDHIWNFLYIDGKWVHLDATWDDHNDLIFYDYFLVSTDELESKDINSIHLYNKSLYLEAK